MRLTELDDDVLSRVLLLLVSSDAREPGDHRAARGALQRQSASLMAVCLRWRAHLQPQSRQWVARAGLAPPRAPAVAATTSAQRASLAERPERVRFPRYERVSLAARADYFEVSCRPITKRAEDDMEMLSDVVTWGERFLAHWQPGVYACARCGRSLYHAKDKWSGPCIWPSWRRPVSGDAISASPLTRYNSYTCAVAEVYCAGCELFLGHMFEDALEHGDTHPDARWRH